MKFAYLIVIDFESTCWENDKYSPQEIIEFPAVLMNTTNGQIESEFHYYLQPSEKPFLSEFCQKLTGITQDQVDNGIPLSLCLRKFSTWLKKLKDEKGIVCADDREKVGDEKVAAFVTWSDWDLAVCLHYETKRKQITKTAGLDRWIDLRATYRKFYSRKPDGLNGALQDLGIVFSGREHSGLDDARNTAKLAWRMIRDGCVMDITKNLTMTVPNKSSAVAGASVGPVASFHVLKDEDASVKTASSNSTSVLRLSERNMNVQYAPQPLITKLNNEISNKKISNDGEVCREASLTVSENTPKRAGLVECKKASSKLPMLNPNWRNSLSTKQSTNKNSLPCESSANVNSSRISQIPCGSSSFVCNTTPLAKTTNNNSSVSASDTTFTKLRDSKKPVSLGTKLSYACATTSTTPSFTKLKDPKKPVSLRTQLSHACAMTSTTPINTGVNSNFKTPKFNTPQTTTMKMTPPLCACGRRAKRRLVQNQGPNTGRWFFSCSIGSPGVDNERKSGCKFFKWETPNT
ncbi:ERI1 exoribonuclease 2-like isoform X2 [Physella acuta]|uniref:ERI1 exoribonuclease 2-like isoform X2 n=1 Tax=Physella acuta TaxID=109671 RepID=UPI0027DB3CD8|nr:ERI1 exoribonuclease 2-like isoform X2 [Physella acuta]